MLGLGHGLGMDRMERRLLWNLRHGAGGARQPRAGFRGPRAQRSLRRRCGGHGSADVRRGCSTVLLRRRPRAGRAGRVHRFGLRLWRLRRFLVVALGVDVCQVTIRLTHIHTLTGWSVAIVGLKNIIQKTAGIFFFLGHKHTFHKQKILL